jgi:excinuclease ABC subunit A
MLEPRPVPRRARARNGNADSVEPRSVTVRGAREHNLKNVTLAIPKKKLVVFTGPSGSGKSSMAFDTIFAEGQRRYVESLSSYARQFLGQMEKPKVDHIRGLSPTIAIEQKTASSNPRSTVGTVTEIHDHLRVLYANVGRQHCHLCGRAAEAQDKGQITRAVMALGEGTRVVVLAPLARQRKGEHKDLFETALARGFRRARVDGRVVDLSAEEVTLDKKSKHDVDLVVDRLVLRADAKDRLADSIETALGAAEGTVVIEAEGHPPRFFSEKRACVPCGVSFDEVTPLSFSFNSPLGFCPDCNGLGSRPEMDPDLVVPRPELSIRKGAIAPWASAMARGTGWVAGEIEWIADELGIDLDTPWARLPERQRKAVLFGDKPRRRGGPAWEGLTHQLMRRMKNTESAEMKEYYMQYFSSKTCAACGGTRLRPERRAVRVEGVGLADVSAYTIDAAHAWVTSLARSLRGAEAESAVDLV